MKITRSFFTLAFVSLMFLGFLVLGIPVSGFAQNPHVCPGWTTHLGNNLGNKATYDFQFYRDCPSYWSYAITWQFIIQNAGVSGQPVICKSGDTQVPVPVDGKATLSCSSLPTGTGAKIKVTINFTVPPNNPMTHAHTISNY